MLHGYYADPSHTALQHIAAEYGLCSVLDTLIASVAIWLLTCYLGDTDRRCRSIMLITDDQ